MNLRIIGLMLNCVCVLLAAQGPLTRAVRAQSGAFEVGIARSNMIWESGQKQATIIARIRSTGVRWFRDAFAYPPDRTADFVGVVRQAKQAGLKILVVVTQSAEDYDNGAADNAGPDFQKLCGWPDGSLGLSQINVGKFKSRLRGLLSALKAARLDVDAFEIGNEVDWVCFNGDVPFGRDARPDDIETAARGYARFLQAAAEVIHKAAPRAEIVTAGLAHIDDDWDRPLRHHLPNPAAFVASLRNLDGKDYLSNARVDGIGSHIYPDANDVVGSVAGVLAADKAVLGTDLPIWITEFGFHVDQFPNRAGDNRSRAIADFFAALSRARARFGPVFYYSYDDREFSLLDSRGNLLPEAFVLGRPRRPR